MAHYPIGTTKLTWIDGSDNTILHSKLFATDDELSNEEDAMNEGYEFSTERTHWLIFKLISANGDNYNWKLLPYGDFKTYQRGISVVDFFVQPI